MNKLLILLLFPVTVLGMDIFDEEYRLFIPELKAGKYCYEDVGIQFYPGEDGMWNGGFELLQSRQVECTEEFLKECGNSFGPDCVKFDE